MVLAEKLLFAYFQKRGKVYHAGVKGESLGDRVTSLARLREKEGRLSKHESDDAEEMKIVEYHDPLRAIAAAFPTTYHMEEQMLERVLGRPVQRDEEVASAIKRLTRSAIFARDSVTAPARIIGAALSLGQTIAVIESWPERVATVTADDIAAAARAIFKPARSVTSTLLPGSAK